MTLPLITTIYTTMSEHRTVREKHPIGSLSETLIYLLLFSRVKQDLSINLEVLHLVCIILIYDSQPSTHMRDGYYFTASNIVQWLQLINDAIKPFQAAFFPSRSSQLPPQITVLLSTPISALTVRTPSLKSNNCLSQCNLNSNDTSSHRPRIQARKRSFPGDLHLYHLSAPRPRQHGACIAHTNDKN